MKAVRLIFIMSVILAGITFAIVCARSPWGFWMSLAAFLAINGMKKSIKKFSAYGTAKWADRSDLEQAGMLSATSGLIVGRMALVRPRFIEGVRALFDLRLKAAVACEQFMLSMRKLEPPAALVRLVKAVHILITAPTGAGKSVSLVIWHLLTSPDSQIVIDFKGELFRLTADARRAMGHQVVVVDPYKVVTQTPDQFNALDEIKADSPLAIDDSRSLAEAFVIRTGEEHEAHWLDSAELWISAMVAAVTQFGEAGNRSLQTVRTLLTDPTKMEAVIKMMSTSEAANGMMARLGNQLAFYKDKELASVLTTTNRFLRFLDTQAVSESTKASSFDPKELRNGKMTIYLVLPPEHMRTQSPLLRMWISSLLRVVVRGGLQETNKVHFVLDEAASLGHMAAIDDAMNIGRGYGIRLQFYYQSLAQVKVSFPNGQDQTLRANTTQVFFSVNDQETAEYVSNRLGESTIIVVSGGTNRGESQQTTGDNKMTYGRSKGENDNWQQVGRKLLKPEEVAGLSPRTAITFTPGVPPIMTELVPYYEEPNLGKDQKPSRKAQMQTWKQALALLLMAVAMLVWLSTL